MSEQIEQKREQLHQQVKLHKDLAHPQIIKLSQELDALLNEMNRLYKQKKHSILPNLKKKTE